MKAFLHSLAWLGIGVLAQAVDPSPVQQGGAAKFVFTQAELHVLVRYYKPVGAGTNSPVVFVMHGINRNGRTYLRDWMPYARERCFVLVVPEFSDAEFPGAEAYQDGNIRTWLGSPVPRDRWTYNMIEPIFDEVCRRTNNHSVGYMIYGHSAGAQFVQRFVCFLPHARVLRAVSANAGSYMLPDAGWDFPYGFGRTGLGEGGIRAALARPLVVLLGTADTDPHHEFLQHSPEAGAQGPYRLARGRYCFACGEKAAAALKTPFGWTTSYAPGIGHSDKGMVPFAIQCLFPKEQE